MATFETSDFESLKEYLRAVEKYFCNLHDVECNQKYDKTLPYSFHLKMVVAQVHKWKHLLDGVMQQTGAEAIAWGHDSIEDARKTYNDTVQLLGETIAEGIWVCSEERGKDRAERKPLSWVLDLSKNKLGTFVKVCDITANSLYSTMSNSSMIRKAKTEWIEKFRPVIQPLYPEFEPMIEHLTKIYLL